jgi:hypothetical protein
LLKKIIVLVHSFFLFSDSSSGQTLRRPVSAGYISLGAYSINHVDVFSFMTNQAALAQLKKPSAGVYGERRFLLSELNTYSAVAGIITGSGNFGLEAAYSGFTDYNETLLGLAYGRKLGTKVDAGVQFNYQGISISAGYGKTSAISFDVGVIMHLSDKLHAGLHITNPVGGKFGINKQEKLSSVYSTGLGYDASEKFFVSAEIEKEEEQPVNVNAGMQYKLIPQLLVRIGLSSATSSGCFGIGLSLKSFRLDVTTSYHPQLGITPGILLLFNFTKTEK